MPRMSKGREQEMALFLTDKGRVTYNKLCRKCVHTCKQSFRALVIECPRFRKQVAKQGKL